MLPAVKRALRHIGPIALLAVLAMPAWGETPKPADLRALRFYYESGDQTSVEAELRRLSREFPGWTPPSDLSKLFEAASVDPARQIAQLVDAGDFAAARAAIDAAPEGWKPSAELLEYLRISEGEAAFAAAIQSGQADKAFGIARSLPQLVACERINNAWELANAYKAANDNTAALKVYRATLQTCTATDQVIATLQKAADIATADELQEFARFAQARSPASARLIREEETRLLAGMGVVATSDTARSVETNAVATDSRAPGSETSANAGTGGWAATRRPRAGSAPAAPRNDAAGATVAGSRPSHSDACSGRSAGTRAEQTAQRGWCAYNANRKLEAIALFQEAMAASRGDAYRDAAYGLLLSLLSQQMTDAAAELAAQVPLTRSQRIEIEGQILDQRGVAAFKRGDYARAIQFIAAHEELTESTRRDLTMLRGYALLRLGKREAAREIFEHLHRQLATEETRKALRAAGG